MKGMLQTALSVGTVGKMGIEPDLKCETVNGESATWRQSQAHVSLECSCAVRCSSQKILRSVSSIQLLYLLGLVKTRKPT